jgi:hypothetical protein
MAYRKVKIKNNNKKIITYLIFPSILLIFTGLLGTLLVGFILFLYIIYVFLPFVWDLINDPPRNYRYAISNAYNFQIKQALQQEYPEGIIYILQNAINELDKFGITECSNYQKQYSFDDGPETRGVPNRTTLSNAIKLAQKISQEWEELDRLGGVVAQIQAMETIKNLIKQENIYLDWDKNSEGKWILKIKGGQPIYEFWYTDEDHQAVSKLKKNTYPKPPVNNPSPPPQRVLTFEEFLQQHPGLFYLTEPEQREEYHKYLASMGVQPISPTTRPYDPDHSNSVPKNTEDDSTW